jgi:hypothetical protein
MLPPGGRNWQLIDPNSYTFQTARMAMDLLTSQNTTSALLTETRIPARQVDTLNPLLGVYLIFSMLIHHYSLPDQYIRSG